ncbi:MAG TPA: hydroxyisourate hydrolase [Vicinamibacteria bacterium]|nr:hydroxyisourate hydrolase [Vicinamibacteria bacterium]
MSALTTHVLDTASGRPAAGVPARLERQSAPGTWLEVGGGVTDADGRIARLLEGSLVAGAYRLTFDSGAYFRTQAAAGVCFYPHVTIEFEVRDPAQHHHVPLLLSPFGYTTYRGS